MKIVWAIVRSATGAFSYYMLMWSGETDTKAIIRYGVITILLWGYQGDDK